MGYDLGVDLGTTFVAAALSRGGRVEMSTLGNQTVVTPSVVYLKDTDQLIFGDAAARQAISHPDRVEREFKRRLGDPTPVVLGGRPFQVTTLMAAKIMKAAPMPNAMFAGTAKHSLGLQVSAFDSGKEGLVMGAWVCWGFWP